MTNIKTLIDQVSSLKGAKFISVRGYQNQQGEVSNYVINANISVDNAKRKDLEMLQNITDVKVTEVSRKLKIDKEIVSTAHAELIASLEQNLSKNFEDRNNQSKGQSDAYIHIGRSLRIHKETLELHVTGLKQSKEILVKGDYPDKKETRRPKTIAKDVFRKDTKMQNFRDFKIGKITEMRISGTTIEL